ncbi:transposase [Psychrobacter sp. APC 3350]
MLCPSARGELCSSTIFHKRLDTKVLLEEAGHTILWLPPYSPDLNPIEQM